MDVYEDVPNDVVTYQDFPYLVLIDVKRITVCSEAQQVDLTRIASVYIEDYKT